MRSPQIPSELLAHIGDYEFTEEFVGRTAGRVFRLQASNRPMLYVKVSAQDGLEDPGGEAERLRWLNVIGVLSPKVLHTHQDRDHFWLVMHCLRGVDASKSNDAPEVKIRVVAEALKSLHSIDASTCPFDETLHVKMARAETNVRLDRVDTSDLDVDHSGLDARELFRRAQRLRPMSEDIVVTHGDASLPNIMLDEGSGSGFVDCGRLGRADRYHDLAIASRSIANNLGPGWVSLFFQEYDLFPIDRDRLYFYRLLDEFF